MYAGSKARDDALTLICLPHAGATASVYHDWHKFLPPWITVMAAEYPGHGSRFCEPLLRSASALACDLFSRITLDNNCVALFGHSMGALVAYEAARLMQTKSTPPRCLFLSGCGAPHLSTHRRKIAHLSDQEFLLALRDMSGLPDEALDNRELMNLVLPALRADTSIVEEYAWKPGRPLHCPIVTLGGVHDPNVDCAALGGWKQYTCQQFRLIMLDGNHFFVANAVKQVADLISLALQ